MKKKSNHLIQNIRIFWRKHLKNRWHSIQLPLIVILGLIALILGYIGFEKYFMRKISKGISEPFYERMMLKLMGVVRLKWELK